MAINVCRPIILYNDFLPPDPKPHEDWMYLAFGYFDGISIRRNLFKENNVSLEQLWEYDLVHTAALKGGYSSQILYGFRYEEEDDVRDEVFWKDALDKDTEYPFVFVTLLQGKVRQNLANNKQRQQLERNLFVEHRRRVITYLTLDTSSLILVTICREYEEGSRLIDGFHRQEILSPLRDMGVDLSYSFTIAAVQRDFLNNDEKLIEVKGEPISHVYVYAIEREPGSIEEISKIIEENIKENTKGITDEELRRKVKKESILGCNDEVIIIEDVCWTQFLRWFQDEKGILNHSGPGYNNRVIGITTIIGQMQEGNKSSEPKGAGGDSPYSLFGKGLENMMKEMRSDQGEEYRNLERYLYQIINALRKFENELIPDYIFCSMFLPIRMVLQIAKKRNRVILEREFFDCFYEFVKALNLCVQNSVRSDRQFIQSLDFNIRIYGTPVRLNAFYNAFIYNVKKFLNAMGDMDERPEYEFLTCLGVVDTVKVRELFKNMSDHNRLFLISIPENQTYDIKLMLIMLGHEVGHFVGRTVRNREERSKRAVKIVSRITGNYFKEKISEYKEDGKSNHSVFIKNKDYWSKFENKLISGLTERLNKLGDIEYVKQHILHDKSEEDIQKFCDIYGKYHLYTHLLKEVLADGISDLLSKRWKGLFDFLLEKEYLYCLEDQMDASRAASSRQKFSDEISIMVKEFTGYSVWDKDNLTLIRAVDMMMSLFEECEADLVAILMLELSLKDYLYAILKNMSRQELQGTELPPEITIRTGLVVWCMHDSKGKREEDFWWDDKEGESIKLSSDKQLEWINRCIVNFIDQLNKRLKKDKETKEDQETEEKKISGKFTADAFFDEEILKSILQYISICRDTFREILSDQKDGMNKSRMQKQLRDIYRQCQGQNVEEVVGYIQGYIDDYKKLLQQEISKYGSEMAGIENERR